MRAELHWVDGPWAGKLALSARPRGGDWLKDDLARWKTTGVQMLVSLLTEQEEGDLDLLSEAREAHALGLDYVSFPILDRQVPASEAKLASVLEKLESNLSEGKNVLVHCRQGIGRTGLVAACLLVKSGMSPGAAVDKVSTARGVPVPETDEQRNWIDQHAAALAK